MPAVLYGGKAFVKDGKLYFAVICPPCCEPCGPWRCCYETDKFWCGETSDYAHPKRIHGYITISGFPNVLRHETIIQDPTPPDPTCPGHRQDFERTVEFTGMGALNGTYIGTFVDNCEVEPPDSCAAWTFNGPATVCYLRVEIPAVPLTATWYERSEGEDNWGEEHSYEQSWTLTGIATLGSIIMPSGPVDGFVLNGLARNDELEEAIALQINSSDWGWRRPFYEEYSVSKFNWLLSKYGVDCDIIDEQNVIKTSSFEGGVVTNLGFHDRDKPEGCRDSKVWHWKSPIEGASIIERVWTE